jgi:hypothetical protein
MKQRERKRNGEAEKGGTGEKDREERKTERVIEGLKFGEKRFFRLAKKTRPAPRFGVKYERWSGSHKPLALQPSQSGRAHVDHPSGRQLGGRFLGQRILDPQTSALREEVIQHAIYYGEL